mmetsp:Transcript_11468/g.70483  ORF Transcript_11468/g.70483 Transcript_11468/m.70483 type:complete len:206 (-) Transcript_11468:456-1073(-)
MVCCISTDVATADATRRSTRMLRTNGNGSETSAWSAIRAKVWIEKRFPSGMPSGSRNGPTLERISGRFLDQEKMRRHPHHGVAWCRVRHVAPSSASSGKLWRYACGVGHARPAFANVRLRRAVHSNPATKSECGSRTRCCASSKGFLRTEFTDGSFVCIKASRTPSSVHKSCTFFDTRLLHRRTAPLRIRARVLSLSRSVLGSFV